MKKNLNIDNNLVEMFKALYEHTICAVLMKNNIGDFFKTALGVRQGCLLSPVLVNGKYHPRDIKLLQHVPPYPSEEDIYATLRLADDINLIRGCEAEFH